MSDSDGDTAHDARLPTKVSIEVCNFVAVDLVEARMHVTLGIDDVVLEELLRKWRSLSLLSQGLILEQILSESALHFFVALWLKL